MFHCSHPNAFFQPHLHPRGCSGVFLLGLGFQGCSGACSTPFSRLLQPSVRGVVDLGVMAFGHHPLPSPSLCGRVTLSVGVHSVYAPVGESGRLLASFDLREASIPVPVHPASCPFLRFLFRDTVYQLQALYFGLSTAPQVFPWVMAPVSAILHSLGIRMRRSLDTWQVQFLGLSSIPGLPTSYLPRWCSVCGSSSFPPLSGLLRRWIASLGGNLQPPYLCHAPSLPRACGCRF